MPVLDPDAVRAGMGAEADREAALARWEAAVGAALASGAGAVAVAMALPSGHRDRLARIAARAGRAAHLLLLGADPAAGAAERFASVTVLDPAAAAGVRRIRLG